MDSDNTVKQMEMPVWLQCFFAAVGILGVGFFVFQEATRPEPVVLPQAGELVKICQDGATGWSDIGALRAYDRETSNRNPQAARRTLRAAREREKAKCLPYATSGCVVKVAKKPHDTKDGEVYCVQVDFEEYGALWVRSNDMIVTERATTALRPSVGKKVAAKRMAPVFSSKEDLGRMITMAARNSETATAFLLERASRRQAFILEAGEEVAIIDMDGWLEPYYLVRRMSDNRTGWVLCVAFE